MREQLLGYLLGALEDDERQAVGRLLGAQPELKQELDGLRRRLAPLADYRGFYEPPADLSVRTVAAIDWRSSPARVEAPLVASRDALGGTRNWSISDVMALGAVIVMATSLFIPAILAAQNSASLMRCQDNLRRIGRAMRSYAQQNPDHSFPQVYSEGPMNFPGLSLVRLSDDGFLTDPHVAICPSSSEAMQFKGYRMPTAAELSRADSTLLACLQRLASGSYALPLGVYRDGVLTAARDEGRSFFALVADAPRRAVGGRPRAVNHRKGEQNILYEDGRVQLCAMDAVEAMPDNPFCNRRGLLAPGVDKDDSVLGGVELIRLAD